MPKVSIIMGVYNCEKTLHEAIESIIEQSYTDWELIICDDGSSDNSYEIANNYSDKDKRIKLIKNSKRLGLNQTLNNCIALSAGEYIARMDGDDISVINRLEKEVAFLDENQDFAFVSTATVLFDDNSEWGENIRVSSPQKEDFIKNLTCFCHAACMIRKKALNAVGNYTVGKRYLRYEDCNLWHKLYAKGYKGYNLEDKLYKIRDDENAAQRRNLGSRINGAYVKYVGYKLMNIPQKYYYLIGYQFVRDIILGLMPRSFYIFLHKQKNKH